MGTAIMHSVMSIDGFIADAADQVGTMHDWYYNGDTPITDSEDSTFRVSAASAGYVRSMWQSIGVIVMGRHLFDLVDGWSGRPPAGDHVVVVSHRPKPVGWHPEASYHFAADLTSAMATAQELAGNRIVSVNAGDVGGQLLAAGLIDEVAMDVVPVIVGSGKRYFGGIAAPNPLDGPHTVIQGNGVLHLRYAVRRPNDTPPARA